jgi:glycerol-3-phosphate acyltransferase PlsY
MDLFSGTARDVGFACFGYALGCFSTGYYLVRLRSGLDIRKFHSGSTGSTNVGRALGHRGYILTLLGDAAKGAIGIWTARHFGISSWGIASVIVAITAGHIWPVQLGFHGGKGLAPTLGMLAVLDYRAALIAGGIAVLGPVLGIGTVTFLLAALVSPAIIALLSHTNAEVTGLTIAVLLILVAHRDNIRAFFAERRGRKGLQA